MMDLLFSIREKGDILLILKNNEEMVISNVLYLRDLKTNILSLGKLDD